MEVFSTGVLMVCREDVEGFGDVVRCLAFGIRVLVFGGGFEGKVYR